MPGSYNHELTLGAIAQLGERHRGTVEVVGSSPTSSTFLAARKPDCSHLRLLGCRGKEVDGLERQASSVGVRESLHVLDP
jgi:hypothetical protein